MVALYSLQAEGGGTAMTTATESLEALHLWLATEMPELRKPYVVTGTYSFHSGVPR